MQNFYNVNQDTNNNENMNFEPNEEFGRLIVVRGIPGSGRHMMASQLASQINAFVINVDFFLNVDVDNAEFATEGQIAKARISALTVMKYSLANGVKNIILIDSAPTYAELSEIFITCIDERKDTNVTVYDVPCLNLEKSYQFAIKYSYETLKEMYENFVPWDKILWASDLLKPFNEKILTVNFDSKEEIKQFLQQIKTQDRSFVVEAMKTLHGIDLKKYIQQKNIDNEDNKDKKSMKTTKQIKTESDKKNETKTKKKKDKKEDSREKQRKSVNKKTKEKEDD